MGGRDLGPGDQYTIAVGDRHRHGPGPGRDLVLQQRRARRVDVDDVGREHRAVGRQRDRQIVQGPRHDDADARRGRRAVGTRPLQPDRGVERGPVHRADVAHRVPVLGEHLGLAGGEVGEVGLVVGEHPRHELHVVRAVVGQVGVPGVPERGVAPGPLLLARRDGAVRHVHEPEARRVVVPAEELLVAAQAHVRRRHRDVAVPVEAVAAPARQRRVVHAVVGAVGVRERGDRAPGVVGHVGHVVREERLVVVVHLRGHVGPPEERLRQLAAVVQPHGQLQHGAVGAQAHAVHALHPRERVVVGAPDDDGAVGLLLDLDVHREVGRGAVVLRPVELHAPGHPRPGQPHEGGLDHRVGPEQVAAAAALPGHVDAPAELRQHDHAQPLVLQVHRAPGPLVRLVGDLVVERQRVHAAGRPLVHPPVQVRREPVGRQGRIGGQVERRLPGGRGPAGQVAGPVGQFEHGLHIEHGTDATNPGGTPGSDVST